MFSLLLMTVAKAMPFFERVTSALWHIPECHADTFIGHLINTDGTILKRSYFTCHIAVKYYVTVTFANKLLRKLRTIVSFENTAYV